MTELTKQEQAKMLSNVKDKLKALKKTKKKTQQKILNERDPLKKRNNRRNLYNCEITIKNLSEFLRKMSM